MTLARVTCSARAWAAILAHAAVEWPREACGLLVGRRVDATEALVEWAEAATNLAEGVDAFELDPALRLRLQRELREAGGGRAVLGHYHSHPFGAAEPSARDSAHAEETGLIWLIVSSGPDGAHAVGAYLSTVDSGLTPLALFVQPDENAKG